MFAVSDTALGLPDALSAVKDDSDTATAKVNELLKSNRVGDDAASQLAAQRF
jgi:hypothetical protein